MPTWMAQNLGNFIRCDALPRLLCLFDGANIGSTCLHKPYALFLMLPKLATTYADNDRSLTSEHSTAIHEQS